MQTLYIQCTMGVAGAMLMGALLELLPAEEQQAFLAKLNSLGIPGVRVFMDPSVRCGITGTHVRVTVNGEEEGAEPGHKHHGHEHDLSHDHAHGHEHDLSHDHAHDYDRDHINGHDYNHDHDHIHEHVHTHDHAHTHDRDHTHDHDHIHGHSHEMYHDEVHHNEAHRDDVHVQAHGHGGGHDHGHHHVHRGLKEVRAIIEGMDIEDAVKADALAVYDLIAQAESKIHGESLDHIHFHEVGSLDAVTDVVGNCMLLHKLAPARIAVSPIRVGSGTIRCAHGMLPVPAPATALLLAGLPIYSGDIESELCTPTGAALLRHFADEFGAMPTMMIEKMGYGMGTKEFPQAANCVRVLLGEAAESGSAPTCQSRPVPAPAPSPTEILELACNLDDMTGEEIGYAMDILLEEGALDVYTQPITMKKSRPAVKLSVLAQPEDEEKMTALLLRHTTTIGVRVCPMRRTVLERRFEERQTPWGPVTVKVCQGCGVKKEKPEFDQVARIAREQGLSLAEVKAQIEKK